MKKLLLVFGLVCIFGLNQLFAANPIPSYHVLVTGKALFQETGKPISTVGSIQTKEKRLMNIETSTSVPTKGIGRTLIVAMLYQLDGQASMGPYYIFAGQSLMVPISDKPWGVTLQTDGTAYANVYTNIQ